MTILGTVYLNGCNYQVGYDLLSQSQADNTSTLEVYGVLNVTNNYVSWSNGSARVWDNTVSIGTYYSRGSYTLVQKTITVGHDENGYCDVFVDGGLYTSFVSGTASGTATLPRINRMANIISATNFTDEENPTITFNNPGNFRINARLEFAGSRVNRENIPNTGSYTFNLTEQERNLLRSKSSSSNTLTVREVIATCYSGTTESAWSYQDKKMTIVNANPTFSNFEFEETETINLTGSSSKIIKGYSDVRITISDSNKANALKSASIVNYQTTIGTKTNRYNDTITYPLNYSVNDVDGSIITTFAIDSRGNSTSVNKPIEMIEYNPISYSNFEVVRTDDISTDTTLIFDGKIDLVDFGNVVNKIVSIKYYYKKYGADDSTYVLGSTTLNPTIDNDGNISINQVISGDVSGSGFNQNSSYTIKIEIVDELLNVYNQKFVATEILGSGSPALAISENKVSLGMPYDDSIGGRVQINEDSYLVDSNGNYSRIVKESNIIIDGVPRPTGRVINGKKEYILYMELGYLPNQSSKYIATNVNIDDIYFISDIGGTGYRSRDKSWFLLGGARNSVEVQIGLNGGVENNKFAFYIQTLYDRSDIYGVAYIKFTYAD